MQDTNSEIKSLSFSALQPIKILNIKLPAMMRSGPKKIYNAGMILFRPRIKSTEHSTG
jgi:hypothetical protein